MVLEPEVLEDGDGVEHEEEEEEYDDESRNGDEPGPGPAATPQLIKKVHVDHARFIGQCQFTIYSFLSCWFGNRFER